jgi:putative hydrolase of the HAD superfamily
LSGFNHVRIVFFDAGETLVHPLPSFSDLFSSICSAHGLHVDADELPRVTRGLMAEVEEKQKKGFTFTDDEEKSRRFWLRFYSSLVTAVCGVDPEDGLALELYRTFSDPSNYGLYPDAAPALATLKEKGFLLGMISNFEPWLEDLMKSLSVWDLLDVAVISGRVGLEKPHPGIFRIALQRAGIEPREGMHVGDSPLSDYRGAQDAGLTAVLLDRRHRYPRFQGPRITDLKQLTDLLGTGG